MRITVSCEPPHLYRQGSAKSSARRPRSLDTPHVTRPFDPDEVVKTPGPRGSIPRLGVGIIVRKPCDLRVRRLCVLALCLCPGGVLDAQAQPGVQARPWSSRSLTRACWFGGSPAKCASEVAKLWDSAGRTALLALRPVPEAPAIVADGTFVHPAATALYALKVLVPQTIGSNGCGQLRADRQELGRLMCTASLQLGVSAARRWPEEHLKLVSLERQLTDAGCLAASTDPCARVAPGLNADVPPAALVETTLVNQSLSEPFEDIQ